MAGVINVVAPFVPRMPLLQKNPRNKLKGENKTMELVVGRGPQQEAASRLQAHHRGRGANPACQANGRCCSLGGFGNENQSVE